MFGIELTTIALVAGGAIGWIVFSKGWGWVLAQVEAFIAKEKAMVVANVALATYPDLAARITAAEAAITQLKAKAGI